MQGGIAVTKSKLINQLNLIQLRLKLAAPSKVQELNLRMESGDAINPSAFLSNGSKSNCRSQDP
ncbi:hypothetical protein WB44_08950 [Synechococcus sp. WH 8020]|nr:hypothetical protein WB44_08950 [Synechococcus sp. WH 8020]